MQESLAKGLDVAFQGWDRERSIRCMSLILRRQKRSACGCDGSARGWIPTSFAGGSTAQILRKFLEETFMSILKEEMWELKDVLKRPCLILYANSPFVI